MASQVISFRLGEEALAKLGERTKEGESFSQAAQRLLNELLGTAKEIELSAVDNRIQEAIAPIKDELAELRLLLTAKQEQVKESDELTLTQAKLAERLGCDASTVNRRRDKSDFTEWSREQDPDGMGWQFLTKEMVFVPVEGEQRKKQAA
jgi:hypothetical protein